MTIVMTTVIMKSISKSKLKSQLLEFLRLVESEGEEIVLTDRSKASRENFQIHANTFNRGAIWRDAR